MINWKRCHVRKGVVYKATVNGRKLFLRKAWLQWGLLFGRQTIAASAHKQHGEAIMRELAEQIFVQGKSAAEALRIAEAPYK